MPSLHAVRENVVAKRVLCAVLLTADRRALRSSIDGARMLRALAASLVKPIDLSRIVPRILVVVAQWRNEERRDSCDAVFNNGNSTESHHKV